MDDNENFPNLTPLQPRVSMGPRPLTSSQAPRGPLPQRPAATVAAHVAKARPSATTMRLALGGGGLAILSAVASAIVSPPQPAVLAPAAAVQVEPQATYADHRPAPHPVRPASAGRDRASGRHRHRSGGTDADHRHHSRPGAGPEADHHQDHSVGQGRQVTASRSAAATIRPHSFTTAAMGGRLAIHFDAGDWSQAEAERAAGLAFGRIDRWARGSPAIQTGRLSRP